MSHKMRGRKAPETVKIHAATVRMDDADKARLRQMTSEHPLYTESVIIRAALQAFLAYGVPMRTEIVLASLNEGDVSDLMRRHGMLPTSESEGTHAV